MRSRKLGRKSEEGGGGGVKDEEESRGTKDDDDDDDGRNLSFFSLPLSLSLCSRRAPTTTKHTNRLNPRPLGDLCEQGHLRFDSAFPAKEKREKTKKKRGVASDDDSFFHKKEPRASAVAPAFFFFFPALRGLKSAKNKLKKRGRMSLHPRERKRACKK